MDNKDKDVKSALDELFGSDFIEISVGSDNTNLPEKNEIENNDINQNNVDYNVISETNSSDNDKNSTNFFTPNYITTIPKKENKGKSKYVIIISIIILLILGISILCIAIFGEKKVKCTLTATDTGYKFYNKYYITHKMNDITFIKSRYKYTATTDEYKNEVENVKGEKIPIVINTNGMPGFTYTYETTDVYYKMDGYIDFSKINFNKIDKLDQNLLKLSEYKINSKLKYKDFVKTLEKDGYICKK